MHFSADMPLKDIVYAPLLCQAHGKLISSGTDCFAGEVGDGSLAQLQQRNPTWNKDDMLFGLERLAALAETGMQYVFPVYTPEEVALDPQKAMAQLFYLPAPCKQTDTFALLMAGGAYGAVCTLGESLPVAARLNELGMDCFCLNYRTAIPENFTDGLMPKPLDDVAAALKVIEAHAQAWMLSPNNYLAGGFSAGGHLAGMWGTDHLGARHYGLPAPKGLMLIYPMISLEFFEPSPMVNYIRQGMLGQDNTDRDVLAYAISRHVDPAYPPVYLLQSEDDDTVGLRGFRTMEQAAKNANVPILAELISSGGHGFGLGSTTPAKGWPERALDFFLKH